MADRELDYKQLAEKTKLHPVTVNKLKNTFVAPARIDSGTLYKLCKALQCQPGDLMRFELDEGDDYDQPA